MVLVSGFLPKAALYWPLYLHNYKKRFAIKKKFTINLEYFLLLVAFRKDSDKFFLVNQMSISLKM